MYIYIYKTQGKRPTGIYIYVIYNLKKTQCVESRKKNHVSYVCTSHNPMNDAPQYSPALSLVTLMICTFSLSLFSPPLYTVRRTKSHRYKNFFATVIMMMMIDR